MSGAWFHVLHYVWSQAVGLLAGLGLGWIYWYWLPPRKGNQMNLGNIVRVRDLLIGVVLVVLAGYSLHLASTQKQQRECLLSYISNNSETQKVRSALVSVESQATRNVILSTLTATTREQVIAAREEYKRMLDQIDTGRKNNPVQEFDEGRCE